MNPVMPTYISGLLPGFLLFDHRNDLFVRKSRPHRSVILVGDAASQKNKMGDAPGCVP
jgi:hypothetical protein